MTDLTFYDAAYPPASPPATDGVAFYIGGDTPHVWTRAEVDAQPARYRLPIFVRSHPAQASAADDVAAAVAQLAHIGAPRGCLVAWDSETSADPAYIHAVYDLLTRAGYKLIDYGSQSTLFGNNCPNGYYWGADWTAEPHIAGRERGTQYAPGSQWDLDLFTPGLPFWDTHAPAPVPPRAPYAGWQLAMPVFRQGDAGSAVQIIQGLLIKHGFTLLQADGIFGPVTDHTVRLLQEDLRISVDGVVGPQTWGVLA